MTSPNPHRGGVIAFALAGVAFLAVGTLVIVKPISFATSGGVGAHGSNAVFNIYGESQSVAFGVVFVLISVFLFAVARRLSKD
ncbi:hypothetical protein HAHE_24520 [Haloferula helveola]|uniref:Uncharacterized protein n=1 Tax=Haloferula helveola TaxID=490095 RepID=A0ABM7RAT1_9BACT|nr:hypothetical protein HAHE_24520 [Haloferula helveola]